jgi:phosphotriesterase-related protein
MKKIIRTILEDIIPSKLGKFNYHEHAFQISPLLPQDDLSDFDKSRKEFQALKDSGFDSYLEATPIALGRNPENVAEIAKSTGLNIIHATGFHKTEHYLDQPAVLALTLDQKEEIIEKEICEGFAGTKYRAGLIKAAVGEGEFSEFEKTSLLAAAKVSKKLDVAVMIHLDHNSDAIAVLDFLSTAQVKLARVALAHADSLNDLELLKSLARRGVYLGFDRAVRIAGPSEVQNLNLFGSLVAAGFTQNILFGGDLARSSRYLSYGGGPGLAYLYQKFIPKLIKATDEQTVAKILVENPISWLSFTP